MELMEALRTRRAVREFTADGLDKPLLEELIRAAILAPSALNRQPWVFAVCNDRCRIADYSERARQWLIRNPGALGFGASGLENLLAPGFDMFYHAPALIIVAARSASAQDAEDCCLAAQNLMLAARDKGIGSCCIGLARPWLNLEEIKKELGIHANFQIVAPIVFGYPTAWPNSHGREQPEIYWL